MNKFFAVAALAASLIITAQPVFAESPEETIDRILRKQLADSQAMLEESIRVNGDVGGVVAKIQATVKATTNSIPIYRPHDIGTPRPPIGNFDALNSPGVFGPTRPGCMPYYEGCWQR